MKNLAFRLALGMAAGVLTFGWWHLGKWLGSLMTERTPFYFAFHNWASTIICPIIGVVVAIYSGRENPR